MSTIQSSNGNQYIAPGIGLSTAGYIAGSMASGAIGRVTNQVICGPILANGLKENNGVDTNAIRKALKIALDSTGMKDKGVTIKDYSGCKPSDIKSMNRIVKEFLVRVLKRKEKVSVLDFVNAQAKEQAKLGANALYADKAVHVNIDRAGVTAFHELGHAINENGSKFWKMVQHSRRFLGLVVIPSLPIIAMCKRKKVEGEETTGPIDKVTTFIKENVGKLTTLAFIPVIAEEFKATARGNKIAKELLSPELAKKVSKCNKMGGLTYVVLGISAGVGAFVANKIKDAIAKPKLVKNPEI